MPLWDGRFNGPMDDAVRRYTTSLPVDRRLAQHDLLGSLAHAKMLGHCGIIAADEAAQIVDGLAGMLVDLETGALSLEADDEDIHSLVERVLTERVGPVGGKLHTARSRNDQVATDFRLWTKAAIRDAQSALRNLQAALLHHAEQHLDSPMPGYTHLQPAQPVLLTHHLLAYFWMLQRDWERLDDAHRRTDVLPLGAAALAGTTFPIDRAFVARELGFARISENSMDAVADRDFAVEFVFALTLLMTHLSRLCEELVLWSSREFGFVDFADRFATGSSIMPQKKNPDVAELGRGKVGRVLSELVALVTLLKGLPLTYNRDLQDDKAGVFAAFDVSTDTLAVLTGALESLTFNTARMRQTAVAGFALATDLADALTRHGMPFREAHAVVGRIVRLCLEQNRELESLSADELQQFHPALVQGVIPELTVEASLAARACEGGTAPAAVRRQLEAARAAMLNQLSVTT